MINPVTCKVVFRNLVNQQQAEEILSRYTKDFVVANFNPKVKIGCNEVSYIIIDISQDYLSPLMKDTQVKDANTMHTLVNNNKGCGKVECGGGSP